MDDRQVRFRYDLVESLQAQARAIALELKVAKVSYDTLVLKIGETILTRAWEVPAIALPADKPLALTFEGLYISQDERFTGREVRPMTPGDLDLETKGEEIRFGLYALERKHDVLGRLRRQGGDSQEYLTS